MRRRLIALLAILFLLLPGCSPKNTRPLLWYQDVFTEVTLQQGDTTWRIAPIPGGFTAEILAPASVVGITFTITDAAGEVSLGDLHIPVSEAMSGGCVRMMNLFRLREDQLIGIEAAGDDPEGITCARFRTDTAEYTVGLRPDGLPAFFEQIMDGITTRYGVSDIRCGDG